MIAEFYGSDQTKLNLK